MLANSWNTVLRLLLCVIEIPRPKMKAIRRAVITPMTGGISIVKRPESIVSSALAALSRTIEPTLRNEGNTALSTQNANEPAMIVET